MDAHSNFKKRRSTQINLEKKQHRKTSSALLQEFIEKCDEEESIDDLFEGNDSEDEDSLYKKIKLQKSFLEQVRFQPWTMKKKLKITSTVKDYLERYEGKLSKRHGCWEKFIMSMRRFKRSLNDFAQILIPWEMKVKAIESHFGSVVSSYFVFLRWLMWINIWLAALPLCFLIIPEISIIARRKRVMMLSM
ncbi:transmembrane channel-like protein 3 [Mytilus edulis]|uniref:transmembrane channel-like protein 3 n=1 Tax=Mytilus edulis TaxID=6550 RepID=UPI0039EE3F31